ncbi:hypothetical protein PG996_011176 [Apiospora saccharicola]|uniref:2EXR domain-containing protein n=1 Tax=Apiospora saccharicola TaxID=335842 RepID=A0ABR1UEB2_9PEZI
MAEFSLFSDFAPEIRCMIWRHALEEESSNRMVLVHQDSLRIMPSKSLRSSLMLASHESRLCAKELYNIQIDVYAMPPLIVPEDDCYEAMCSRIWPNEDEDHDHKNWERMAYYCTEWDRFVLSPEFELVPEHESPCLGSMAPFWEEIRFDICLPHFTFDLQHEFLGPDSSCPWAEEHREGQWHHASGPLSPHVRHMIRKVVAVFDSQDVNRYNAARQHAYSGGQAAGYWRSDIFDAIEAYLLLRCEDAGSFIDDVFAEEFDKRILVE